MKIITQNAKNKPMWVVKRKIKQLSLCITFMSLILLSCNQPDFPDSAKKLDDLITFGIFNPPGENLSIIPPDPVNSGPACSCGSKDERGSSMTKSVSNDDQRGIAAASLTKYRVRYKQSEVLIKFRKNISKKRAQNILQMKGLAKNDIFINMNDASSIHRAHLAPAMTVENAIAELSQEPDVAYVQPNYIYHVESTTPNDYEFNQQWSLNNTGQTINSRSGISGYDINATKAWDTTTDCSTIIIAVIDTGINYNHNDLKNNMWDGSACVDESGNSLGGCLHGYNFVEKTKDPKDKNGHGTHVAGIIGATGNNGDQLSGVCWMANIMAVRSLDAGGMGTTDTLVSGIKFAVKNGAKIINASWGDYNNDPALYEAINDARTNGVLFIAAAGNNSGDNDASPMYPAGYNLDNILSVAAIDQTGRMASFSNYGATSVHIAAPGTNVLSTFPAQIINTAELFSSWSRETGWTYKDAFGIISVGSLLIRGWSGILSNYNCVNNMDSCAYRVFDLTAYNPDLITLNFGKWYKFVPSGDYVYAVYDTDGKRPTNTLGTLESDILTYGYDITPFATSHTSLGFRFATNQVQPGEGIEIAPFFLSRWYHYNNATACMYFSGTSMATPLVAGAAGLVWANNPGLTYTQVKNKILNGARINYNLDGKVSGSRMLDAYGALNAAP